MPLSISSGVTKLFGFAGKYPEFLPNVPVITGVSAVSFSSVAVTFTAPSNHGSSAITNYTITSSPGNIVTTVNQSNGGTVTVTGLTENTTYTFTISATNSVGTSATSQPSASVITPIAPPTNTLLPVLTGNAVVRQTLSCTSGTWAGYSSTYTYQWQRTGVNITGATNSTYTLTPADFNATVRCVVTATNGGGSTAAISNATTNIAATVPEAPTISKLTMISKSSVRVTFVAPTNNGGATVTGYIVTSSPGNISATVASTVRYADITGLTTGQAYTFTAKAINSVGQSAASAPSSSITPIVVTGQAIYAGNAAGGTNLTGTVYYNNYTWTVPEGVTRVSVVCVGAGGRSFGGSRMSGGGGALAYANNISVFPGDVYTIAVGNGLGANINQARTSRFLTGVCEAQGGDDSMDSSGNNYAGAVISGTGGRGGMGGRGTTTAGGSGGGGAGGYAGGNVSGGGQGAAPGNTSSKTATAGTAGAGGGGGANANGGGVGLFGQGTNGAAGGTSGAGGAGSGGTGQTYGGGAGCIFSSPAGTIRAGGHGAVRIIWPGDTRQFPSTNVGNF
jgi:hypothetical protein